MTTTLADGAKKHCWNIVFRNGAFQVLSPDNNIQLITYEFNKAIEWCNNSLEEIPQDFKELVENKKKELIKNHLKEFGRYYRQIFGLRGVHGLHTEVYDFVDEYDSIRHELQLGTKRTEYDYLSNTLKELVFEKITAAEKVTK